MPWSRIKSLSAFISDIGNFQSREQERLRVDKELGNIDTRLTQEKVPAQAAAAAAIARALAGLSPDQKLSLPSSSEELSLMYGSRSHAQEVQDLEEGFYEEEFDPIRHIGENIPEENELAYFEEQATLRLAQLDMIAEQLSRQVMEHHEVMVKGMNLVRELEKDLKVATVICMNGRRHLTSSRNEVSRDLIVSSNSRKKQALLEMLPILSELRHALDMQATLESLVGEGNYFKSFQVLSEYLQVLDGLSELSAVQEMSQSVEAWLGKTLQNLDALLLGVCQEFNEEGYLTVIDAYALIGDISGVAEKIQSFFMQEALSETNAVLKTTVQQMDDLHWQDQDADIQNCRFTYSDLCLQIQEPKFRQCLLRTLAILFRLMCSYYAIMNFQWENKVATLQSSNTKQVQTDASGLSRKVGKTQPDYLATGSSIYLTDLSTLSESVEKGPDLSSAEESSFTSIYDGTATTRSMHTDSCDLDIRRCDSRTTSSSGSPWYLLRKDAIAYVSQTLQRGRKNLWQLTTSRISVLLSSPAVSSTSIHQFLKNYEDLDVFILAGEAFCGIEAVEFRQKLKAVCGNYFISFHRQNILALKMVLEKENWMKLPPETIQMVSFSGLVGDGAAPFASFESKPTSARLLHSDKLAGYVEVGSVNAAFSYWLDSGNPFSSKLTSNFKESHTLTSGLIGEPNGKFNDCVRSDESSPRISMDNGTKGKNSISEDDNEDLLADFIDEDSQLPSRISKPHFGRSHFSYANDDEIAAQTGSSLCLLRLMDKYARLMHKLELVSVEFFKGICQLFEVFFHFVFEAFGQQSIYPSGKSLTDLLNYRLKTALSKIMQDCDQWMKVQPSSLSSTCLNPSFVHKDLIPMSPPNHLPSTMCGLKERCAAADTISRVAKMLYRSKTHLQSMLLQNNSATIMEDFYTHLVESVPDLVEHIHRTTARLLLHTNGYVERIASAKWEPKELGIEHNGYIDLLLGEFKHYKTRLTHGGVHKEVQDLLLEYGVENVAETLVEGLSRVKRCTDEGRVLMSLDLQVLINGLQHLVSINVRPKLQMVETYIKAYYLPETEFMHWAHAHPEYTKSQIVGLINLVATMKGWKRKTRLEILEKIE